MHFTVSNSCKLTKYKIGNLLINITKVSRPWKKVSLTRNKILITRKNKSCWQKSLKILIYSYFMILIRLYVQLKLAWVCKLTDNTSKFWRCVALPGRMNSDWIYVFVFFCHIMIWLYSIKLTTSFVIYLEKNISRFEGDNGLKVIHSSIILHAQCS